MNKTVVKDVARTCPGMSMPDIKQLPPNEAVSSLAPFRTIKHLLEQSPPPRRPNRNRPISDLQHEMDAWDAASEESWAMLDDDCLE